MADATPADGSDGSSLLTAFVAEIDQLSQLLHLAWAGAGTSWGLGSLIKDDPKADPKAALLAKFGEEQVRAGFPVLYEVATVRLHSILGAIVRSFVKRHAANRPNVKRPKEKLYGVDQHERRLERIGYGGSVPPEVRRALMELSATRDVIVHHQGRADDRFLHCCPWLNLSAGDKVRTNNPKFVSYQKACSWYAIELSLRALQAGEVEIPGTREKHLESQAIMMEEL
jgi:hypothetical protein